MTHRERARAWAYHETYSRVAAAREKMLAEVSADNERLRALNGELVAALSETIPFIETIITQTSNVGLLQYATEPISVLSAARAALARATENDL